MKQFAQALGLAFISLTGSASAAFEMQGGSVFVPSRYVLMDTAVFSQSKMDMDSVITETASLKANDSQFGKLYVEGSVNLVDCVTHKTVLSWGNLVASNSNFLSEIKIYGGTAVFDGCHLKDLVIINENSYETVRVYLSKNTLVQGSVNFPNGCGEVYKDSSVVILGDVTGGEVINWE